MSRARIPNDAKVWLEVGTQMPKEVAYDARIPFSICWVITDGEHRWKYLWIKRRRSGVYLAHALPDGFHESYHADGTHHWKSADGNKQPLTNGPPLDSIHGFVALTSSSADIRPETLRRLELSEFEDEAIDGRGEKVDKIIYLDCRTFGPYAYSKIYLVEPFRHGQVPIDIDRPSHLYLVTHTVPWILVTITEGT